jgi:hypothetical protein
MAQPRVALDVALINPHAPCPYTFNEAALCLQASIRAAGHACALHVNRSDSAGRAIVLGALPPHLPAVEQLDPRRTAIFNFEQLGAASSVTGESYAPWLRRWLVVDYHSENIAWLRAQHPAQRALELPVVPGPAIAFHPGRPLEPVNDVLFFGTLSPRREEIIRRLREAGLSVEVVAGAFGDELTPAIKRARLVLHVHYYERGLFPVARILQPVAQGVPLVCEDSVHSQLNDWSRSGIVFAPYEQLAAACAALVSAARERDERARANQAFAAALDFATPFERLLREMDLAPPPGIEAPQLLAAPPLPQDEIEAELAREATELPEAHETPPPLKLVERVPGQGRYGLWIVVLLVLFSAFTIWQGLQALMRVP